MASRSLSDTTKSMASLSETDASVDDLRELLVPPKDLERIFLSRNSKTLYLFESQYILAVISSNMIKLSYHQVKAIWEYTIHHKRHSKYQPITMRCFFASDGSDKFHCVMLWHGAITDIDFKDLSIFGSIQWDMQQDQQTIESLKSDVPKRANAPIQAKHAAKVTSPMLPRAQVERSSRHHSLIRKGTPGKDTPGKAEVQTPQSALTLVGEWVPISPRTEKELKAYADLLETRLRPLQNTGTQAGLTLASGLLRNRYMASMRKPVSISVTGVTNSSLTFVRKRGGFGEERVHMLNPMFDKNLENGSQVVQLEPGDETFISRMRKFGVSLPFEACAYLIQLNSNSFELGEFDKTCEAKVDEGYIATNCMCYRQLRYQLSNDGETLTCTENLSVRKPGTGGLEKFVTIGSDDFHPLMSSERKFVRRKHGDE